MRWRRRNSFTIRPWRVEVEDERLVRGGLGRVNHFFFLAGLNPTFNPTFYNPTNGGYFLGFGGDIFATIEVGLGLVGLGVGLGVILQSFLVILPPILPQILPQFYLKSC